MDEWRAHTVWRKIIVDRCHEAGNSDVTSTPCECKTGLIDHLLVMVSACFAVRDEARDSTEVPPVVSPPDVVEDCSIGGFFLLGW